MPGSRTNIIGGNSRLVRNINRSAILNLIREQQPISRVTISRITGLNKSTVSSIVSELLESDYLVEELVSDKNIGRNPYQLRLKIGKHFVGAVNFDTRLVRVAIVDIDGRVVIRGELQSSYESPREYVEAAVVKLNQFQEELNIKELAGIGVTIAGLIDSKSGYVIVAKNLGWEDVTLGEMFREHPDCNTEVHFENDAEASALAELWFGKGSIKNYSNFVFVSVGAGIGTGIVIDRKVLEGTSYAAGEFGHMTIFEHGEACVCGNEGCWEAYASDKTTVKRYIHKKNTQADNQDQLTIKDVCAAANKGDEIAVSVLKETGKYLGVGMSNILRALDPPAIVLGGRILQSWDIIYPEILEGLSKRSFFGLEKKVKVLPSSLTERPRLVGAATLALSEIFRDYRITR